MEEGDLYLVVDLGQTLVVVETEKSSALAEEEEVVGDTHHQVKVAVAEADAHLH